MKWQVKYALENLSRDQDVASAAHVGGDAIQIAVHGHPDVLAIISDAHIIDRELIREYFLEFPVMDFMCGYRKECIWEGGAIRFLKEKNIGWGSAGTLSSALGKDDIRTATHKEYRFAYRLIEQSRSISDLNREYDRIFSLKLWNGKPLRVGMVREYEPTADAIRTLWERFGPVDIVWSINPNGFPRADAIEAGRELGCDVLQWDELKSVLKGR